MKNALARLCLVLAAFALDSCAGSPPPNAAGPTPRERLEAAEAVTRAERPLVEWVAVKPEQLTEVNVERLQGEAAAVVILRGFAASESGQRFGTPRFITLRNVSANTTREVFIRQTGTEAQIGWGVAILPPGKYALNAAPVYRRTVILANGEAHRQTADGPGGHAYISPAESVTVNGGDVLYLGTTTGIAASVSTRVYALRVKDERAEAARWMQANLPKLAPLLKTRLLHPRDHLG